jgi:hypothetical protein
LFFGFDDDIIDIGFDVSSKLSPVHFLNQPCKGSHILETKRHLNVAVVASMSDEAGVFFIVEAIQIW